VNGKASWEAAFAVLEAENQILYADFFLMPSPNITDVHTGSYPVTFDIKIYSQNKFGFNSLIDTQTDNAAELTFPSGHPITNSLGIFAFQVDVRHDSYYYEVYNLALPAPFNEDNEIGVTTQWSTINAGFTKFVLGVKYTFLIINLLVLLAPGVGYCAHLSQVPVKEWSSEQVWILVLLEALLLFNDPFYAAQIYSKESVAFTTLYVCFSATFLSLLLCFWHCTLSDLSRSGEAARRTSGAPRTSVSELLQTPDFWYNYGISIILCAIIWILSIATWLYFRYQTDGDVTYNGLDDDKLRSGEKALIFFLAFYIVCLLYYLINAGKEIINMTLPFKFLFLFASLVILLTIAAFFVGFWYPFYTGTSVFLTFYSIMNLYVWTLAYAFSPVDLSEGDLLIDRDTVDFELSNDNAGRSSLMSSQYVES
jgi:hypothetical protein